jgi:hypothetical protein
MLIFALIKTSWYASQGFHWKIVESVETRNKNKQRIKTNLFVPQGWARNSKNKKYAR